MTQALALNDETQAAHAFTERRFAWHGMTLDGTPCRGKIVAPHAAAARAALRERGIVAGSFEARGPAAPPRATAREITAFTRHLASLLGAGIPLAQALQLIAHAPARGGVPRIAGALAHHLANGQGFATGLGAFSQHFDPFYRQLTAVGETSGTLAHVLARLAQERERIAAQRAKMRAALVYPAAVLLLAVAISTALLLWVVPAFRLAFESFGAPLPPLTRAVVAFSDAAAAGGPACLAAAAALHLVAVRVVRRSSAARIALAQLALALPVVGRISGLLAAARWCRALGTLLAAGTPLADALASLAHATGHAIFDAASADIAARLDRGERLAAAMRAVACFPPALVQPVAIAEESGSLDTMLLDVAALAEREVDEATALMASLAEPAVVIVLGVLIGVLVVALYLPVIELGNVV
jgi:type IV pilus assembly protein PilC